ncbi:hypothetical protein ScPMuIL_012542 [Solemya velum]
MRSRSPSPIEALREVSALCSLKKGESPYCSEEEVDKIQHSSCGQDRQLEIDTSLEDGGRYLKYDMSHIPVGGNIGVHTVEHFSTEIKSEIESIKPEKVVFSEVPESFFINGLKNVLRRLGYDGVFERGTSGRGNIRYFKENLADYDLHSTSYFHSYLPNPTR